MAKQASTDKLTFKLKIRFNLIYFVIFFIKNKIPFYVY